MNNFESALEEAMYSSYNLGVENSAIIIDKTISIVSASNTMDEFTKATVNSFLQVLATGIRQGKKNA